MLTSKNNILAQNTSFKERKLRLRWLIVISSIPLFGIYAAFGIAPQTVTQDIPISTVIEEISLPPTVEKNVGTTQSQLNETDYWQADQVRRDDTLASLVQRLNISNTEAIDFLRYDNDAKAFSSQLRPGRSIQAQVTHDGELLKLEYEIDSNSILHIEHTASGYQAKTVALTFEPRKILKSAEIDSSLFAATDAANIPDSIAMQVADIFSSEIDFHSDLRKGDHFSVIYEANYNNGELAKTGQVLATEFTNNGKTYRALMYRSPGGKVDYYTPEGKSLHKSFLRSPLEFTRISSGFTLGRFHPILQRMRAHKGVDFAAPIGTRVKATSDGIVKFVGIKGGYGNVIVLQHQNGISTVYGHLSRFVAGLRMGMKVSQGEIIGFVGMTGLATGPHLHYEVALNGQQRDPMKIALPTASSIPAQYKTDFDVASPALIAQLNLLSTSNFASLD
jgi:murein DD-endopeptidase MepM/ murein hydrolase activator NlpD